MTLKFYLGLFTFCISFLAIILNFIIIPPVTYLAFGPSRNAIYVIAFFNIISDLLQLSVTCFYQCTSIMANRYLFSDERVSSYSIFTGWVFMNGWFLESVVQVMMATNRFMVITMGKSEFFTFKNTLWTFIGIIFITVSSACVSQFILPCCIIIADQGVLSMAFVLMEGVYPYSNFFHMFYDLFCSVTSAFCYIAVFRTIRNSSQSVASSVEQNRTSQDIRYLFQFVFVSIFYTFTWVFFEILNHLATDVLVEFWIVVPICITCNCSSNAIIYLTMNQEVRKFIKAIWKGNKAFNTIQVTPAAAASNIL